MYIELVELLRCPREHHEQWLVASIDHAEGRVIVSGAVGCPVCGARFDISDGVVDLRREPGKPVIQLSVADADAWRVAALLDLRPPVAAVVLAGAVAVLGSDLLDIFAGSVIAINPPQPLVPRERYAAVLSDSTVPLRTASVTAVAVSADDPGLVADAARVLRPNGRLLAPASSVVPAGLTEIARDERQWVARRETAAARVQLKRG